MHFEEFGLNRGFHGGQQPAVIDGAQRFQPHGRLRDQGVGAGCLGGLQQFFQKLAGHGGHVAGDQKIPLGGRGAQGGVQTTQGPAPLDFVGNDWKTRWITQASVAFRGSDQGRIAGRVENLAGDRLNQGGAFPWQQRFVPTHAGTPAPGQHEPRSGKHEMMVAIAASMLTNKKVYICFISAFAMLLAASPNRLAAAGDIPAVENSSPAASQKALVVRADRRTGKLVRSVAPVKSPLRNAPAAVQEPSINISEMVEKAARDNQVDPLLVHSIIQVESNYNPYAVSPKGAQGLMQLMPPTARDLGVSDSFDPRQNIEAGVRYLKYLQDLYKDDRLALAAYNAGPGAVQKYKWIPPYPETQDYVNRVGEQYGAAKKAAAQHLAVPAAPPVGVMEETRPKLEPFVDAEGRLHLRNTPQ